MNEFRAWMQAMGFNGKQVVKAGEMIGMGPSTALLCRAGKRRLTKTERLAMAAVTSGCGTWSPEASRELRAAGRVLAVIREMAAI